MLTVLGGLQRRVDMGALSVLLLAQERREAQRACIAGLLYTVATREGDAAPGCECLFETRRDTRGGEQIRRAVLRRLTEWKGENEPCHK